MTAISRKLRNGRLLISRWDNETGNQNQGISLHTSNPDGSSLQSAVWRAATIPAPQRDRRTSTVQFVRAREMEDGRVMALLRPFTSTDFGGSLVVIGTANYVENTQRTLAGIAAGVNAAGPAQTAVTPNDVRTVAGPSPGGRFNSAYPLWDGTNRVLVSWSQCRLLDTTATIVPCTADRLADPAAVIAPPLYSAWLLDLADGTLKPVITPVEGVMITDVVSLQPRPMPTFIPDTQVPLALAPDLGVGVLDIRSVYDWDGAAWPGLGATTIAQVAALPAAQRPARFLRIEKAVDSRRRCARFRSQYRLLTRRQLHARNSLRVDRAGRFGASRCRPTWLSMSPWSMPAGVASGRRIAWQQLRPGEIADCNGCYYQPTTTTSGGATIRLSHGRQGLFNSANPGVPAAPRAQTKPWRRRAAGTADPRPIVRKPQHERDLQRRTHRRRRHQPALQRSDHAATDPPVVPERMAERLSQHHQLSAASATAVVGDARRRYRCRYVADTRIDRHNGAPRNAANQVSRSANNSNLPMMLRRRPWRLQAQRSYDQLTQATPRFRKCRIRTIPMSPFWSRALTSPPRLLPEVPTSTRFFSIFANGASHAGRLTGAELRLLSEWMDIGTQYYNNPFDAPLN
jgi:hypothetical protein